MNNGADENIRTQNRAANKQDDLQELEIDGITFVREQDDEYGPRWKALEWKEDREGDEYGTVIANSNGLIVFKPNIVCEYQLGCAVLQPIAKCINQQTERGIANRKLTTLGL